MPRSSEKHSLDKDVYVQVLLRCRPLSEEEQRLHTPVVISCNENRQEVTVIQNIVNKQIDRTFAFDKVFGPTTQQKDFYDQSIIPIVNDVLEGYNCTIFAYGQTGTGKTYTMEGGGKKPKNGEFPSDAGVIPRAVRQIFEVLEAQLAEYSMKVTFLELYNEEIRDLLAPEECSEFVYDKAKKPIALMEDGKGGVLVRGLEEEIVFSASEIFNILEKGSKKRWTAETLLNKQSSRSHSIFSITIHIKEWTPEGQEMIKCGKLNLVDLAGSENISCSGAREGRAREAGEINKSLLTLGHVINALVEHSEETLSTLDYAYCAKNIENKPEVNLKTMNSATMKDSYSEIERLKQEAYAARENNGICVSQDRYLQEEAEEKQLIGFQEPNNSQQLLPPSMPTECKPDDLSRMAIYWCNCCKETILERHMDKQIMYCNRCNKGGIEIQYEFDASASSDLKTRLTKNIEIFNCVREYNPIPVLEKLLTDLRHLDQLIAQAENQEDGETMEDLLSIHDSLGTYATDFSFTLVTMSGLFSDFQPDLTIDTTLEYLEEMRSFGREKRPRASSAAIESLPEWRLPIAKGEGRVAVAYRSATGNLHKWRLRDSGPGDPKTGTVHGAQETKRGLGQRIRGMRDAGLVASQEILNVLACKDCMADRWVRTRQDVGPRLAELAQIGDEWAGHWALDVERETRPDWYWCSACGQGYMVDDAREQDHVRGK
ncbi:hypothetical protein QJS10_CPB20g00522 [Acorus calamus]|uniref:Kinesin-like protein n=1 Tax=Acorus calamus TaxID=4465 RepID=A0AAV9C950_ACOCL|nr:hypothetical protein QJS10_CPB20g00522 [Acorus calamus]